MNKSLRTIDNVISGSITNTIDRNKIILHAENNIQTAVLLNADECKTIITNANNYGLLSLSHAYKSNVRDSTRLCIIDKQTADVIWGKIKDNFDHNLNNNSVIPFGFDTGGVWVPSHINPCFRISKYDAPSNGFKSHQDSQYCKKNFKSIYTIVIQLNDGYIGGETIFTVPDDQKNKTNIEKKINNKIKRDKEYKVAPIVGQCIVFPHEIFHSGAPVTRGTKYICRTDIVYRRVVNRRRLFNYQQFKLCQDLFRQAQNCELESEVDAAAKLYDIALQLRIKAKPFTATDVRQNCWLLAIDFLNVDEIITLNKTCKTLHTHIKSYSKLFWQKKAMMINTTTNNITNKINNNIKKYCLDFNTKYIPEVYLISSNRRHGFMFRDKTFFLNNKEACMRVAAMYTMILFQQSIASSTYIAQYNPETKEVLACDIKQLLSRAFFNIDCYGMYYYVGYNGLSNKPAWYKTYFKENTSDISYAFEQKYRNKIYHVYTKNNERVIFPPTGRQRIQLRNNYDYYSSDEEDDKETSSDEEYDEEDEEDEETIQDMFNKCVDDVSITNKYKCTHQINFEGTSETRDCDCGMYGGEIDTRYDGYISGSIKNHLIFNFASNKLTVYEKDGIWYSDITPRDFNHASCQCSWNNTTQGKIKKNSQSYFKNMTYSSIKMEITYETQKVYIISHYVEPYNF